MRSVTFDAKLGLFAIPQLWVQAQSFATIFGVAGLRPAAGGTKAMLLYQYSRLNRNPEIWEHLDKLASARIFRDSYVFKPGEWKEATQWMERSGFNNVGGEFAVRDNPWKYDVISDGRQQFLNSGRMFFTEGERSVRIGAWYTSYLEHRAANPTGAITNKAATEILQRADLLYTNMSRASSSMVHQGVWSIPTQFLSYQLRISELFTGKRLTGIERSRLLGTYAMLYGVPGAAGLSGLPLGDWMKKEAIEQGYVVGDNYLESALWQGMPALVMALASGNWYNIEDRYGVQGLQPLRDLLRSDKTAWDVFGGASYSTLSDTIGSVDPFWQAMKSMIKGEGDFTLKPEHFLNPGLGIASVSYAKRLWLAINTGKWMTKKEMPIDDASMGNAMFMTLSGLSPQGAADQQSYFWTRDQEKTWQKEGESKFRTEFQRGLRALGNNDPQQANDYFRNAMTHLISADIPLDDYAKIFHSVTRDNVDSVKKAAWDFYTRNVPQKRKKDATEAIQKVLGNK